MNFLVLYLDVIYDNTRQMFFYLHDLMDNDQENPRIKNVFVLKNEQ